MKKLWICFTFLLLFSACSLLPVEEEIVAAPVLRPHEQSAYNLARVMRGNLDKFVVINVSYLPTRTEVHIFDESGLLVEELNIRTGDTVRRGDILATLEHKQLDESIARIRRQIEENDLARRNEEDLYAVERPGTLYQGTQQERKLTHELRMTGFENEGKRLTLLLNEQLAQRSRRFFAAGMDGVVTFVRLIEEGFRTSKGERLAVITDKSSAVFLASGMDSAYLEPGMEVTIETGGKGYAATVTAPEALGIAAKPQTAFLALMEPASIQDNASGSVRYIVESRENVLYLPSRAVHTLRDSSYVVILEKNMRVQREVVTGMQNDRYIEIVSGLSEGDEVVVG